VAAAPRELAVTLFQMVETGTGPAAYYADVMQAVLTLAITAPPGPPANGSAFLDRLEPGWLEAAYAGDPPRLAALASAKRHLGDIALRYRTLLDRLGPPWTTAARSPTPTPGTSSSKAPANSPWPKRRPWP
jgi:hypothetical protein